MAEAYLGEIRMFAGNFAIYQWQICQGQTLSISSNQALFAIIGTYYGGNGTSTFMLPDFRGRVPISQGQGPGLPMYEVGQAAGSTAVTLLAGNLPTHNHPTFSTPPTITVQGTTATGSQTTPSGNYLSGVSGNPPTHGGQLYSNTNAGLAPLNAATVSVPANLVTGPAGGNLPVQIMPPYLTVTFLIALYGIFPSRN